MNKTKKSYKNQPLKSVNKKPFFSPEWQLVLFVVAIGLIYWVLFRTVYTTPYSAIGQIFLTYASNVIHGQVPYLDFKVEYPPLALLFFIIPRLFTGSYPVYSQLYKAEVFLAILVGLFLIYLISRRMGKAPWKMMLVYTICILAIGPIVAEQFDIFPAVLTLGSIYAFIAGRNKTAWALLALGALTKIYPLFIAPVYLVIGLRNRQYRVVREGIFTFLLITAVLAIPFFIVGVETLKGLAEYHLQRGIQLESTYSSFLLISNILSLNSVREVYNFGSWNLAGKAAESLAEISGILLVIFLLIAYWYIYRQIKPGKSQSTRLGAYALLITCIVLITGKVLSPQYFIWLVPLIPLVWQRGRYVCLMVFVLLGGITYYLFPQAYLDLVDLKTVPVIFLFIRNLLLIILTIQVAINLGRMKASE